MVLFMSFSGSYGVRRILSRSYRTMFISGMNGHMLYIRELDDNSHSKNLLKRSEMIKGLLVNMGHLALSMDISGGILILSELISSKMLLIL